MIETILRAQGQQRVSLSIGLVNNASDRALKATEIQFLRMLRAASTGFNLTFKLFTCPEIPRLAPALDHAGKPYADLGDLFDTKVDALIVTGMEPQGRTLQEEPVWDNITRLVDWASDNSVPVIWSCLAAHAAVLYLDGIARSRLGKKLSGIFACDVLATDHMLASGLPSRWTSPHSRYHGLSQAALANGGYKILSGSDEVGVDVFMKEQGAQFLFFQGHPEYEADTLWRQYKRDLRRYSVGKSNECPLPPTNYLDPVTLAALESTRVATLQNHCNPHDLEAALAAARVSVDSRGWEQPAVGLYANWLNLVAKESGQSLDPLPWMNHALFAQPHEGGVNLVQ